MNPVRWTTQPGAPMAFILTHVNDPHGDDDPCVLWPFCRGSQGYGRIDDRLAHRVLLELRDGQAPEGFEALHGCRQTDCIIHTRWGTAAENAADKARDGTIVRGNAQHLSKLTEADVRTIRVMLADGVRQRTVAEWFKVHHSSIAYIAVGRSWAWLT